MFQKICLRVMVFLCGWILMALEMIGPRLLSRVFGSGIHVWGSIISTFLLALSVGYWLGGQVSRKWNTPLILSAIGAAVSLWILVINGCHQPVNDWLFDLTVVEYDWKERWPALASAMIFFFPPSVLLGMVSPIAIRLEASDIETVGASAGQLYAISTVGSFLGCLITSFYLLPYGQASVILKGYFAVLLFGSIVFAVLSIKIKSDA